MRPRRLLRALRSSSAIISWIASGLVMPDSSTASLLGRLSRAWRRSAYSPATAVTTASTRTTSPRSAWSRRSSSQYRVHARRRSASSWLSPAAPSRVRCANRAGALSAARSSSQVTTSATSKSQVTPRARSVRRTTGHGLTLRVIHPLTVPRALPSSASNWVRLTWRWRMVIRSRGPGAASSSSVGMGSGAALMIRADRRSRDGAREDGGDRICGRGCRGPGDRKCGRGQPAGGC